MTPRVDQLLSEERDISATDYTAPGNRGFLIKKFYELLFHINSNKFMRHAVTKQGVGRNRLRGHSRCARRSKSQ